MQPCLRLIDYLAWLGKRVDVESFGGSEMSPTQGTILRIINEAIRCPKIER
jgi:hypothetical protein